MKSTDRLVRSFAGKVILASCSVGILAVGVRAVSAVAEQQRGPVQRVVQGKVIDGGGAIVSIQFPCRHFFLHNVNTGDSTVQTLAVKRA